MRATFTVVRRLCAVVWLWQMWFATAALLAGNLSEASPPEVLTLESGAKLHGRSQAVEEGALRWELEAGKELWIPLEWVERLDVLPPEPLAIPPVIPTPEFVPTEQPRSWTNDIPLISPAIDWVKQFRNTAAVWTQRLQFGGQFIDGNAQTDLIDLAGVIERNTPQQMRQLDLGGQWGQNAGRETANRWFLNSNFDWPIQPDSPWISFATSKNEYNGPANLDYRGTLSSGVGYRFLFEAKKRLIARFGPAYTIEIFQDPNERRETPDIFGELEIRWPVLARTSLEQKMRVQPSLLDSELVRVFSTTGVLMDLDEKDRWKLRLGLQYTYNSQPNPGRLPNDFISTVSLIYQRR